MTRNVLQYTHLRRIGRSLLRWGGGIVLLVFGTHLLLKTVVATPWAAARTAGFLTGFLHQPVAISGLAISGTTLVADGMVVSDPAGFGRGELVSCRVLRITPVWREILAGRRSFALIELQGLAVTVTRNSAGVWNFGELVKRLTAGKSPAETFVKRFVLEDASFTIAGRKVEGISLAVTDLATKGSTPSRLLLTCRDPNGNAYHLEGAARLGAAPAVNLSLAAPSLWLRGLDRLGGSHLPLVADKGTGRLSLAVHFAGERLEARGEFGWGKLAVTVRGGRVPLRGTLAFSGSYDLKRDAAILDSVLLSANDVVRLNGHGSAERVRGECAFTGEATGAGVELNDVQGFLPERLRRNLAFRGSVVPGLFRFAGDRHHGVTVCSGTVALRHGALAQGGRTLLDEIEGEVALARERQEWLVQGRFFRQGKPVEVPLQNLRLPFSARLSSRFRPLTADAGPFVATVAGIPLEGEVAYRPAAPEPLSVRLEVPRVELAPLNGYLAPHNVKISAGTGTVSFRGAGQLPGRFSGEGRVAIAGLAGTVGGRPVTLGRGAAQGTVNLAAGKVASAGTCRLTAGVVDGKAIDGAFGYRVADREIVLSDGSGAIGKTALRFTALRSAIPAGRPSPGGGRLPFRLEFAGLDIGQDDVGARGMTGSLTADLVSGAEGRWLEGTGTAAAPRLSFRDREVAALTSRLTFRKGEMAVAVSGKALDGGLQGTARLDPFAKDPHVRFSLQVEGGQCALLSGLAYRGEAVQPAGGSMDAGFAGSYSRKEGLRGRATAAGRDIVLAGKGGRTLLADGRFALASELADGNLALSGGTVGVGHDLVLDFHGQVAHVAASDRKGSLAVSIPPAPIASVLTSFVNLLPRPLQEATAAGTVTGRADVRLAGRDIVLDGMVTVTDGALEVPGQKLGITGISGSVPVSLDLAGGGSGRPPAATGAPRKDYARLLQDLRQSKQEGEHFRIGKIHFGGVESGATSISFRAGNGLTEITELKAELYGGELLGKGFVGYRHGAVYGGEFLVHDLSLKMFCDSYPAIKGYITGRLDGIMAFHRTGAGLQGMSGTIDLWTRSGNHEKMLVSKEFLQKLAGKKLKGIFFRNDRPYDRGEISATLEKGYLTFDLLNIEHTNFFGVKDLSVTVVPVQNRIAVDHLISAIRQAAARGKAAKGGEAPAEAPAEAPPATEFKWEE